MKIGGFYNWVNEEKKLVYLGRKFIGNGYWHQFSRVEYPKTVWCEVLTSDLKMMEETK